MPRGCWGHSKRRSRRSGSRERPTSAAEAELKKTAAKLRARRHQLDTVIQEVKELEGRTKNAEARDAEERAAAEEGMAAKAIESFRGFAAFADKLAEASMDAYF